MEKPEKLDIPLTKDMLRKDIMDDNIDGLLIRTLSTRIHVSDHRSNSLISSTKTIKSPSEAKKVILFLGSWTLSFGNKNLEQNKLSQLFIDFGVESFDDKNVKIILRAGLRDKLGDHPFEGTFEIISLFFK
ncbi:MAG: hypothetical protein OEV44_07075 [Spirochaetota bacterium]|nr:hypothetical protein [Spirochaetota bacterium]